MEPEITANGAVLVRELQGTLGRLALALALGRDAFAWIDRFGRIVWCNSAFDALVGREHLDLLGSQLSACLGLERDGRPVAPAEHPGRLVLSRSTDVDERFDATIGDRKLVLDVFARRGLIDAEPAAIVVIHDATEAARAHAALERLNVELASANAELEAFGYSVSHDLRAPLRAIDGFSRALLEDHGPSLPPEARAEVLRVRAATRRMAGLIEDLLRLSRAARTELSRTAVDLSSIARSIASELAASARDRRVTFDIADGLRVVGDERWLRRAMENLMGNAWKFTSKRANARIEVGAARKEGADGPIFFVRDDGAGFDMSRADRMFAPFQRFHAAEDFCGTGIGLAIVRRIVQRHGGRIWAEGAPGKGATFYFTLPEAAHALDELAAAPAARGGA
jgi:signal transduction histidine kinase